MDEQGVERAGLVPLKPDLDRIARLKDKRGIAREVATLHLALPGAFEMGNNATDTVLFGFGLTPDFADAQTTVLMVDQAGMALPGRDRLPGRRRPDEGDPEEVPSPHRADVRAGR